MTKTLDVPYGSAFQPEEKWEISPVDGQPEKCLLVCSVWVRFWKKIMLKNTVETKVIEGVTADNNLWLKNLREKKIIVEGPAEKKPVTNGVEATHGIERSQDMQIEELKDEAKLGRKNESKKSSTGLNLKESALSNLHNSQFDFNDLQKKLPSINFLVSLILVMIILILIGTFIRFKSISENRMASLEIRYQEQQELIYELSKIIKNLKK